MSSVKQVTNATFDTEVLKSSKPVIVDFWAEWCGPCRLVAPVIEEIAAEYEGKVDVVMVDVEENGDNDYRNCCLYCGGKPPASIRVQTPRWEIVTPASTRELALPHRLFYPFSFENHNDMEYESVLNFAAKTTVPA